MYIEKRWRREIKRGRRCRKEGGFVKLEREGLRQRLWMNKGILEKREKRKRRKMDCQGEKGRGRVEN